MTDQPPETPELDPHERAALDQWRADEPPAGFAARVLAARDTPPVEAPVIPRPRRRGGLAILAAIGIATLAATALIVIPEAPRRAPQTGARSLTARESIPLGRRGIAVAEAGAALSWTVAPDGAAQVEQTAGDVFYRVEPGGPFVVATPAGDVRVAGTCFRVEIQMKPWTRSLATASVGAALAAAVVVTVYEGGVVVAGGDGPERRAAAGEQITMSGDAPATPVALTAPPSPDASRDELLARDTAQRDTIAKLATRVASLEHAVARGGAAGGGGGPIIIEGGGPGPGGGPRDRSDGRPFFDPSPELLLEMAALCEIRYDHPDVSASVPTQITAESAARRGIEPGEIDIVNAALRDLHEGWRRRLVALYVEATGDEAGAEGLSPSALAREIEDKAAPGEEERARTRMARERAGLEPVPADLSQTPPIERYLRGVAGLGDEMERLLAAQLGPERARALRAAGDGWGSQSVLNGCADQNGGAAIEVGEDRK